MWGGEGVVSVRGCGCWIWGEEQGFRAILRWGLIYGSIRDCSFAQIRCSYPSVKLLRSNAPALALPPYCFANAFVHPPINVFMLASLATPFHYIARNGRSAAILTVQDSNIVAHWFPFAYCTTASHLSIYLTGRALMTPHWSPVALIAVTN